jgi:hypothetical protein
MSSTEITGTEPTNEPGQDYWAAQAILSTLDPATVSITDRIEAAKVHALLEVAATFRSLDV